MIIAGDIGGTKTLLQASMRENGRIRMLAEQRYDSRAAEHLNELVRDFRSQLEVDAGQAPANACFAVAGPVAGRQAWVTNLDWDLDCDDIAATCGLGQVRLINDFQAVGYGLHTLADSDVVSLQAGRERQQAPRVLIGAGTGLGQAILVWDGDHYEPLSSEGGHADFAPGDPLQAELWAWLAQRHGHVSWERVCSGNGLVNLFDFLCATGKGRPGVELEAALREGDRAATISEFALEGADPVAEQALDLFVSIYGAQAGNLALTCLADGGVYIAGGIAPRILDHLRNGVFLSAFRAKGRLSDRLGEIPVWVIVNPHVGLMGAVWAAWRL